MRDPAARATTQRVKSPFYAYPSSIRASAMGCARTGCYGVDILDRHQGRKVVLSHGPFSTIQAAEDFADGLPLGWDELYLLAPLGGSVFAKRRAAP